MAENEITLSSNVPTLGARLLWWFGIYFAAQLFLIYLSPFLSPSLFWMFPAGPSLTLISHDTSERMADTLCISSYALYVVHLSLTLTIRNRRAFVVLMFLLTILVGLSLYGLVETVREIDRALGWLFNGHSGT